ncbi:MAG: glycosyl transferase, family 2 [Frankiales bacterium]|nr:glycosyl transferase, family 2 [Frankiales bacterium]
MSSDPVDALRAELAEERRRVVELEQELARARTQAARSAQEAQSARAEVQVMRASTSWRVSAPVRLVAPLRTALQGPPQTRTSLRRPGALRAAAAHLQEQGLRRTLLRVRQELGRGQGTADYRSWVEAYDTLSDRDRTAIRRHVEELHEHPVVSVVVPTYRSTPATLRAALDSVTQQLYPHWQLVVCDDASGDPATLAVLAEYETDARVVVVRRTENGGIARATNDALAAATGDLVAFLDHDDVLAPHALYLVALEVLRHPETDVVYSDEDKLDADGLRWEPHFKPAFDPDLLLAQNYLNHLTVVRRSLLEELGGLSTDLDGAQDHDLVLRATTRAREVRHLPYVLYHWRQHPGSGTYSESQLDVATDAMARLVQDHVAADGGVVEPSPWVRRWNRVVWPVPDPAPGVTVVVPTRDRLELLRECLRGLLERTDYPALQVLVVDNDSVEPATLAYLEEVGRDARVTVLRSPGPFNYSALNNEAVRAATTPLVLLLNNDIVVREPGWLAEMVSQVVRPDVGVVGARLLYADERVQHAGVVLGIGGVAGHSHKYANPLDTGYFGRPVLVQGVSAVTGACLLTHRELFLELGGLDEVDLAVAFNDVDYCLRVRSSGRRVVYTPFAELYHLESASRGLEESPAQIARFNRESAVMRERWGPWLRDDPAYNLNLSDTHEDFRLAVPPRVGHPWEGRVSG